MILGCSIFAVMLVTVSLYLMGYRIFRPKINDIQDNQTPLGVVKAASLKLFANLCLFCQCKNWSYKFSQKNGTMQIKTNQLLPFCQLLQNFSEGNLRKSS